MKYNEIESGTLITVEGRKDDPNGWWGAVISPTELENYINGFTRAVYLNHKVLEKIVKVGNYEIIHSSVCNTTIRIK